MFGAEREVAMRVWKRRAVLLIAVGVGSAGLMLNSAGAQTPPPTTPPFTFPSIPGFEFPDVPDFPTIPTFVPPTILPPTMPPPTTLPPPPTMPPPTTATTSPPPTMPPTTSTPTTSPPPTMPPPTSPPTTIPSVDFDEVIEELLDELEQSFEQGTAGFEEILRIIDDIRHRFFG